MKGCFEEDLFSIGGDVSRSIMSLLSVGLTFQKAVIRVDESDG